jgi:hypothetical protein
MHRHFADPAAVHEERVRRRRVIYFDTNIWSDLSEAASDIARQALELSIRACINRNAVFPLSYALITEFLKREQNSDSARQADLMDLLSDGVTFRGWRHILDLEVLSTFEYMTGREVADRRSQLFTLVPCYIADGRIVFPDGWTEQGADEFMLHLREHRTPGLSFLQQHMRTMRYLENHDRTDDKYVREISEKRRAAAEWAADPSGKLNPAKLREEEHTFVFKRYIMENLPRLVGIQGMALVTQHLPQVVRKPGRSALRNLVEQMPSTWVSCELNVQATLSRARKTEKQEFYDHEHASLAIPYADAFVTSDGELADVLRRIRPTQYPCVVIRGTTDLLTYLAALES